MLLTPGVWLASLFVIAITGRTLPLVFGIKPAGLFEDPTTSVGMIGRLVGGAVSLVGSIEYSVQARWTVFVSFEWPLPLTRLGATKSGIDRRIFGIVIVASTLVFVASGPAVAVSDFGSARVAGTVTATS